ncbi:hypothetical protein ABID12_003089 [Martelella mangrovi]|uniref:Uncharacterized protein n=1 Tax=Martelella mangrovi TaxID=1397477 RepID=A0ABV2IDZ3_9HYPH
MNDGYKPEGLHHRMKRPAAKAECGVPVRIFDRKNPERLLGFLCKRPSASVKGGVFWMAISRAPTRYLYEDVDEFSLSSVLHVKFQIAYRDTEEGWMREAVLQTDEALETLKRLPDFRFPGETGCEARMRQGYFG